VSDWIAIGIWLSLVISLPCSLSILVDRIVKALNEQADTQREAIRVVQKQHNELMKIMEKKQTASESTEVYRG